MRARVGTSGFSYPAWKGSFYPEDLPTKRMLSFYAGQLGAVEINNTFYRMPSESTVQGWAEQVPESFQFVLKAPQVITHVKRLADVDDAVDRFCTVARGLGSRLGPALFQLPPGMKKDLARLEGFLKILPKAVRAAFEFRHESWFTDDVYGLLRAHGAIFCVADAEELQTPKLATSDVGYLRLRRQDYDAAAIAEWARWIKSQPWAETYVFFKHEDEGKGPALALEMGRLLGAKQG